ncbi:mitochondrial inner membrane protease subunit 1 isoform X2 [Bos indicus]|uniref:Mitochondrial inner membrane protease subunit 1 isoform X2 n=1 Tax=Bos indicus TaxID=9915 RepID=A0ABM4QKA5_BOSIN
MEIPCGPSMKWMRSAHMRKDSLLSLQIHMESWYCGSPIFALRHALDVFFWKPCKYCKNSVYCCKDLWGIFPTQESNRGLLHCSQRESERALAKMGMSRGSEGGQRRLATGHRVQSSGRLTDRFRAGSPGAMHRHAVQPARRTRSSALCGREPWAVVAGARSEGALGAGGGTSASQSPQTHSRVMWRGGRAEERRQRGRHGARDRVGRGGPPW